MFALVGGVIGSLVALWLAASSLLLPAILAGALAVCVEALLTGGMHLDGLADTFDGLGVRGNPTRALEAMRDSRIGATGATALVLHLLVKWAAMQSLLSLAPWFWLVLPVSAAAVGRFCTVWCMHRYPYARSGSGLGAPFSRTVSLQMLVWCALLGAAYTGTWGWVSTLVFPGQQAQGIGIRLWASCLGGVVMGVGTGAWLGSLAAGRLGGMTGDVYGAVIEIASSGALVGSIAVAWLVGRT